MNYDMACFSAPSVAGESFALEVPGSTHIGDRMSFTRSSVRKSRVHCIYGVKLCLTDSI